MSMTAGDGRSEESSPENQETVDGAGQGCGGPNAPWRRMAVGREGQPWTGNLEGPCPVALMMRGRRRVVTLLLEVLCCNGSHSGESG